MASDLVDEIDRVCRRAAVLTPFGISLLQDRARWAWRRPLKENEAV